MAIKKPPEEHENHERWLVSYADFITLLFAFFVVLYASSDRNQNKLEQINHALVQSFGSHARGLAEGQDGLPWAPLDAMRHAPVENRWTIPPREVPKLVNRENDPLSLLWKDIDKILKEKGASAFIAVELQENQVSILLVQHHIFPENGASIRVAHRPFLTKVFKRVAEMPNEVWIVGMAIEKKGFPLNKTMPEMIDRAIAIREMMVQSGIKDHRIEEIYQAPNEPPPSKMGNFGTGTSLEVIIKR